MEKVKRFLCKKCIEIVSKPQHLSKDPKLCYHCWRQEDYLKRGICISCKKKLTKEDNVEDQWGRCNKCQDKIPEEKEIDYRKDWEDFYPED